MAAVAEVDSPEVAAAVAAAAAEAYGGKEKQDDSNESSCFLLLMCGEHVFRIEELVELLFAQQAVLEYEVIHTLAGFQCLFGDLG